MPSSLFLFFEAVADELTQENSRVLTRITMERDDKHSSLFDDLRQDLNAASAEHALDLAIKNLTAHFYSKGGVLPFEYEASTGRFKATDVDYLTFVSAMSNIRSIGTRAIEFELGVLARLQLRLTGSIHRVGFPRQFRKNKREFNQYLQELGFNGNVLVGQEKDGGFDILWMPPLGSLPHRPIVSVQCKNGAFDLDEAYISVGSGSRSLCQHAGLQSGVHVPCVLFNDYFSPERVTAKQLNFVPLGLSDLSALSKLMTFHSI
jgi:hypothetical protein